MNLPVLSAAAVREAESKFPTLLADGTLMERAAAAVASECLDILRRSGGIVGRRIWLLVGPGDNGGDGLLAGARLAHRGVEVRAVACTERVHTEAAARFHAAGGRTLPAKAMLQSLHPSDLVIDAIAGLGSTRGLDGDAALLAERAAELGCLTIAVDVPSGVATDTGAVAGAAVRADLTVTFGALRRAHVVAPGALLCGDVHVADIGVPMDSTDMAITNPGAWFAPAAADVDKFARGVVGVVAGSAAYPGAALLACAAAQRSGAGFVRYYGPAAATVVAAHPEVVPAAVDQLVSSRCSAWLVGCGLGTGDDAVRALTAVLARTEPVVIDADAITLVAARPDVRLLLRRRADRGLLTLLTPHSAEARRLAQCVELAIDPEEDRLAFVRALALEFGAVVLLKGPTTIVDDGGAFRATPPLGAHLATAGSGDVLAGLIAGAAARWAAAGLFTATDLRDLAAAAAIRHSSSASGSDTIASDLIIGLEDPASATMLP